MNSHFVTFYSYKGGVGRTAAIVNTAILRAEAGDYVVVIDFDLEAPGTGAYFKKLDDSYNENRRGILEYLVEAIDSTNIPTLRSCAIDLSSKIDNRNGGRLWAIGAGDTTSGNYPQYLERLKWREIFATKAGELVLANLKGQVAAEFEYPDFVFVDSRTGITETAGVCTRYLADTVVFLTSLNEQNINGSANIYRDLKRSHNNLTSDKKKKFVLVASNVPVGMPYEENQLFNQRMLSFCKAFDTYPDLHIYNYPVLSLAEIIPVSQRQWKSEGVALSTTRTDPLIQSYRELSSLILSKSDETFQTIVREAIREIDTHVYLVSRHYDEHPNLDKLKSDRYRGRLISQLVTETVDLIVAIRSEKNPSNWDMERYLKLLNSLDQLKPSRVKSELTRRLSFVASTSIKDYLSENGGMKSIWEKFVNRDELASIALREIGKHRFEWPIEFYSRRLKEIGDAKLLERVAALFNLAQAQLRMGKGAEGRHNLAKFVEAFNQTDFSSIISPASKANYNFCAGIGNLELGHCELAIKLFESSLEALKALPDKETIFSPISYVMVSKKEFEEQVRSKINQINAN